MDRNRRFCRICMQDDVLLDWEEEFCGMSFKDCYYKYTQIKEFETDPFPQLICEACSTDLKSLHLFVKKAIETHNCLEQQLTVSSFEAKNDHYSNNVGDDEHQKIECVYMEENDNATEEESQEADLSEPEFMEMETKKSGRRVRSCAKVNLNKFSEITASKKIRGSKKEKEIKSEGTTKAKTPVMCSYCSKIIHNAYYLKKHEQTHKDDREREVTCSKCGLKSYTKTALYIHMKIHDKNREKKFKCEFCDKAFFHRGACNVHRRIHLGQMVKCPLCPKEFYRQIDLDKHMPSHSHAPLHASKQTKSKYVVHCKECNKEISSAKFNAHRAAHMNEPLMRCTLCEKDFFSRVSCTRHMGRVHKRSWDNYDDITIYYEKYRPRLSHVLMEQQEEVEAKKG